MRKARFTELSYVIALIAIALLIIVSTSVAFIESYDGLLLWSKGHGLKGWRADAWPLQVDAFIAIGESALFIATLKAWDRRGRVFAWTVTISGAVVSVAANVGHVGSTYLSDQVTAALPPLAACGGLTIGLQILKRVIADRAPSAHDAAACDHQTRKITPVSWKIINGRIGWTVDLTSRGPEHAVEKIVAEPVSPVPEALPAPEQVTEKPSEVPQPQRAHTSRDDRWEEGVRLYRESLAGTNKPMSQRTLADALGMKNRTLAAEIIKYVKDHSNED